MIYLRKEGKTYRVGLNISYGLNSVNKWPWVSFIWMWFDIPTRQCIKRGIRIRPGLWPMIYFYNDKSRL